MKHFLMLTAAVIVGVAIYHSFLVPALPSILK